MKRILLLSAILVASSAFATQPGNNGGGNGGCGVGQQTNDCGSTGGAQGGAGGSANAGAIGIGVGVGLGGAGGSSTAYGGKGGEGGSAAVVGSGNSSNRNENSNVGLNLQGQQQSASSNQSQSNTSANSVTGYGGNATGNGAGNSTSVNFEGSTYKEAAQTAYAPTPQGPRTSCRLFVGLGGSGRDGSLSGGIPISNDQTCMSGAQIEFMNTVNKIQANTFTVGDYLIAVCAAEGMDKMSACQKK